MHMYTQWQLLRGCSIFAKFVVKWHGAVWCLCGIFSQQKQACMLFHSCNLHYAKSELNILWDNTSNTYLYLILNAMQGEKNRLSNNKQWKKYSTIAWRQTKGQHTRDTPKQLGMWKYRKIVQKNWLDIFSTLSEI